MRPRLPSGAEPSIQLGLDTIFGAFGQRVHQFLVWSIAMPRR
jgi:hypothetical protein